MMDMKKPLINGSKGYVEYIASSLWKQLRLKAIERDVTCRLCDSSEFLQVHHRRYPSKWEDDCLDNLTVLCSACHDIVTDFERRKKYSKRDISITTHIDIETPQFGDNKVRVEVQTYESLY